tara:strand:- start:319 stop:444 length:126 start_codon:yes stop_codon:yes gene_type:complete
MADNTDSEDFVKFADDHAKWIYVISIGGAFLFAGVVFLFIL